MSFKIGRKFRDWFLRPKESKKPTSKKDEKIGEIAEKSLQPSSETEEETLKSFSIQLLEEGIPLVSLFQQIFKVGVKTHTLREIIDIQDSRGVTLLHVAIEQGNLHALEQLVSAGADLNAKNPEGKTPLHLALDVRDIDALRLLIESGADVSIRDSDRRCPLLYAIEDRILGHDDLELLINDNVNLMEIDEVSECNPLMLALSIGNNAAFQVLVQHEHRFEFDQIETLFSAVPAYAILLKNEFHEEAKALNASFKNRVLTLYKTDKQIHKTVEEVIDEKTVKKKAVREALLSDEFDRAENYINRSFIDVSSVDFSSGVPPPLYTLVESGKLSLIESILEKGADPNIVGPLNRTPLHNAIISGDSEMARLLCKYGADVSIKDKTGSYPLHYAAENQFLQEDLEILISDDVDINAENVYGSTPLKNAIAKNTNNSINLSAIQCLIDHGAVLNDLDGIIFQDVKHSYNLLRSNGYDEIASVIDNDFIGELSYYYNRKMIAHRFAIEGYDVNGFEYEGFHGIYTQAEIGRSFRDFLIEEGLQDDCEEILDAFLYPLMNPKGGKLLENYQSGNASVLSSGFFKHSTFLIFHKNSLFIADKGAGAEGKLKLKKYPIDPDIIDAGTFQKLTKMFPDKNELDISKEMFFERVEELLQIDLKNDVYVEESYQAKFQIVGNCSWASAKLALRAIIDITYSDLPTEERRKAVNDLYKEWRTWDIKRAFHAYLEKYTIHEDGKYKAIPGTDLKLLLAIVDKFIEKQGETIDPEFLDNLIAFRNDLKEERWEEAITEAKDFLDERFSTFTSTNFILEKKGKLVKVNKKLIKSYSKDDRRKLEERTYKDLDKLENIFLGFSEKEYTTNPYIKIRVKLLKQLASV